jgi:hypothetical protein
VETAADAALSQPPRCGQDFFRYRTPSLETCDQSRSTAPDVVSHKAEALVVYRPHVKWFKQAVMPPPPARGILGCCFAVAFIIFVVGAARRDI